MEKKNSVKYILILNVVLAVYSLLCISSKLAAQEQFLSSRYCFYYGIVIVTLFLYAIIWQQMLKKIPLVTAYANKAITVIWGIIWGRLFFGESITIKKLVGALVIMVGVFLVVKADEREA